MARNHPTPAHLPANTRSPFHHPVGAGHARPATSRRPPSHLPCSPKTPNSATLLPPITPIICARQPPSPQYAPYPNFSLKLCRKNQKRKSKNLQKPVDKGHTTCYNNQAVSRAQPAAAAAGAFTYSLYAVFLRKLLQKTFRKPLDKRENLIYNIQAVTETRQRSRTLKIEQN